jgi:undecaprenyl-diphosphatase
VPGDLDRVRFRHPWRLAGIATTALVASWILARQRPVPAWELRLTDAINRVPDLAADVSFPVMQLGTLGGPFVVAAVLLLWRRDVALAAAAALSGTLAWFAAKGVKRLVERDRPAAFLPELIVREGDGAGLGFVSGHSAVAAAVAVIVAAALPARSRPVAVAVAIVVGLARIVHGVHLPADVIGGWSVGVLVGLASLAAVDHVVDRTHPSR